MGRPDLSERWKSNLGNLLSKVSECQAHVDFSLTPLEPLLRREMNYSNSFVIIILCSREMFLNFYLLSKTVHVWRTKNPKSVARLLKNKVYMNKNNTHGCCLDHVLATFWLTTWTLNLWIWCTNNTIMSLCIYTKKKNKTQNKTIKLFSVKMLNMMTRRMMN